MVLHALPTVSKQVSFPARVDYSNYDRLSLAFRKFKVTSIKGTFHSRCFSSRSLEMNVASIALWAALAPDWMHPWKTKSGLHMMKIRSKFNLWIPAKMTIGL